MKRLRWLAMAAATIGCSSTAPHDDPISIGLMLSYTGYLAANSINSERALLMALESANAAGGVAGRPLAVLARDTRSDVRKVTAPAQELIDAGVPIFIGPDNVDLVTELRPLLVDRTIMLPSLNTSSDLLWKPRSWFVMGANTGRVACELAAQVRGDERHSPLVIMNANGYNNTLAWDLSNRYGMPKYVLRADQASTRESVQPITSATADSYVLATFPPSGASLISALAATGALTDGTRWYLSPALHTPFFLESVPRGVLTGARGVAPGTVAGAADFRARFLARWQDEPLDDAYPFYDTGAVAVLALQRAVLKGGALPTGTGLGQHIVAVTHAGGTPITWAELDRGLELLRQGEEIEYVGLSGPIEFDASGLTPAAMTKWWTIGPDGFTDVAKQGECQ
jgi:ABC-type branched-subunit amino acid transport system substrate-binding protein